MQMDKIRGYSYEQIEWLQNNAPLYTSYRDLKKDFNEYFGCDKSVQAIFQHVTKRLGIHLRTEKVSCYYTEEETKWLIDNYNLFNSYGLLAIHFNNKFGRDKSPQSIWDKCSRLNLRGISNSDKRKNAVEKNYETREKLFRGKRTDNGEWVYGDVFHNHDGRVFIGELVVNDYHGKCDDDYELGVGFYEVIPETVGQWTGLHDKNGTKIFEGDIMNSPGNVVEFFGGSFCINGDSPLSYWTMTKIIGNVHDK